MNGFLGIGTAEPNYSLHVHGNASFDTVMITNGTITMKDTGIITYTESGFEFTDSINATSVTVNKAFAVNTSIGLTNSSLYLCKDSLCVNKCNAKIIGGIITSCI